jgi:hypothetical protein
MQRRFALSLGQTVALILAGGAVVASAFLLMPLLHLERGHAASTLWLRLILSASPMLIGGYVNLKGASELKDGIANQRWPRDAIAPFSAIFESIL